MNVESEVVLSKNQIENIEKLPFIMQHPLTTSLPGSIEDSYSFGWLRGLALMTETLLRGRWHSWLSIIEKGEITEHDPYPELHVAHGRNTEVSKMLQKCYEPLRNKGYYTDDFLNWIGWGLGISWFNKPSLDKETHEHLYKTFNLDLMLEHPNDHLSPFLAENGSSGVLEFYPTPNTIATAMNRMLFSGALRSETVYEPCIGAGSLLLSSGSLNLVGSDLSQKMVYASAIQAFLYMPSLLYTPSIIRNLHFDVKEMRINKYYESRSNTRLYVGNSLKGELHAPADIFLEGSDIIDIFFQPIDLSKREVFHFVEEMEKPWNNHDRETKIKLAMGMAREIPIDICITNPPFNSKISAHEKEEMNRIEKSNKDFLKKIQRRVNKNQLLSTIEKEVEYKITISKSSDKKIHKEQLMFEW